MDKFMHLFHQRDPAALGRLLKEVENESEYGFELLKQLSHEKKGNAHVIGITGPPGVGKSTMIGNLCKDWAKEGVSIGVVCVDPTSPFSGGALLGDRIRMQEISKLSNVFIKSLATRGNLGGLAASTSDVIRVFDHFGMEIIIVETVGVGQIEYDILDAADTVVLVNVPGLGDSLQTYKAGIMEIADLYVINQADRAGAEESAKDLRLMIHEWNKEGWEPPVLMTVATKKDGMAELVNNLSLHKRFLQESDVWRQKRARRNEKRLHSRIHSLFAAKLEKFIHEQKDVEDEVKNVAKGFSDPFSASENIIQRLLNE